MLACIRQLVGLLLSGQPIPQHIAFIMDGNRRYADTLGLRRIDGHQHGYSKMKDIIQWCIDLGVRVISVYAFSIDNFKRPAGEVEDLMQLATDKFEELLHDESAKQWGAELRVIGDLSLAPPALQAAAARLMQSSRESAGPQARAIVNICFSYTSSQELQAASDEILGGLAHSHLLPHDVGPSLLQRVMHTKDCPPVDLMIRTSGEQRLSDFLLWQSSHALLHWEPCLWPQFGFVQLIRAVMAWQAAAPHLAVLRAGAHANCAGLQDRCAGGQQELLLGGSCGGSGAASPPMQPMGGGLSATPPTALGAPGGGGGSSAWQQQDVRTLVQLQRSSELLLQLQKQQQRQQWWGGLLFTNTTPSTNTASSGSNAGGSSSDWGGLLYPAAAAAAGPPAGRSPERASSTSLSVISEDEATCVPHPYQAMRLEGWLRRLDEQQEMQLRRTASAGGKAGGVVRS